MTNRISRYIGEARDELRKVVWPTRRETTRHTVVVVVISLAVAAFLGLADYVLNFFFENFLI